MKKLETYVNEKLNVSKENTLILDTGIYELSSIDKFNIYLRKAKDWLNSFAKIVPKNKSNKNILNNDDLYISIDTKFKNYILSVGYKNKETVLFIHDDGYETKVMKDDYKGNDNGWRVYDTVFIVPEELKDDIIEIINYKI